MSANDRKYRIVRMYEKHPAERVRGKTGLTLQEAQAHCRDPETSSRTCTSAAGKKRTRLRGPWFEGYEAQ